MIPIAIEPTLLAYGVYCSAKDCEASDGAELNAFLRRLRGLFESLNQHHLGIALTKDLCSAYRSQVPYSMYSDDNSPVAKIARELYNRRLSESLRVVHTYGNHSMEICISSGVCDDRGMLVTDNTYLEWLDLLGLTLLDRLPPFILSHEEATVFCADTCIVEASFPTQDALIYVSPDLTSKCSNQGLALWRLAHLIRSDGRSVSGTVPCKGTGTHSSMWDRKIHSLDEVPEFERSLLTEIVMLGLVHEFRLLDFPRKCSAVSSPAIESLEVQQGNVLLGLLRGKGSKQHAQRIYLHLRQDCAELLKAAMGDRIDIPGLDRLKKAVRHLRNASGGSSRSTAP